MMEYLEVGLLLLLVGHAGYTEWQKRQTVQQVGRQQDRLKELRVRRGAMEELVARMKSSDPQERVAAAKEAIRLRAQR